MTNKQTHFLPDWRQLCQAALFETNPVKLLERIAQARNAVLDRIEDGHTKPLNGEQHDLRDALTHAEQSAQNYGASKCLSVKG